MIKKLKKFFHSYSGRNFFSRHWRRLFEKSQIRQIFSLGLVLSVFIPAVVTPQALAFTDTLRVSTVAPNENISTGTVTATTFQFPLKNFFVTQEFSWHHWGVDLSADEGSPVFPVATGKVVEIKNLPWGFGNYLLIDHQNGQRSLYAHLSQIEVKEGQSVGKETIIGRVGHTGWATGNHLHLEVYQNGLPLNPLEVLPAK